MENTKKQMGNQIKLIDLYYVDGNYGKPIKTQGFKALVKSDKYYKAEEGYVFIEPKTQAFMVSKYRETLFEKKEDADAHLKSQLKSHIEYAKKQIQYYTDDLAKYNGYRT